MGTKAPYSNQEKLLNIVDPCKPLYSNQLGHSQ